MYFHAQTWINEIADGEPDPAAANALQQVTERFAAGAAEVHRLEEVLHHGAHLAELPAQTFLQGIGGGGIGLVGNDLVDQLLGV